MVLLVWTIVRAWQRNLPFFDQPQAQDGSEPPSSPAGRTLLRTDVPLADFAGIGLVIGFGQYIYHGGRLLPILAAFAFAVMIFKRKVTLLQLAVAGLAALAVVLPLATFYASNMLELTGRTEDVFIFSEANLKNAMGPDAAFATHLLPYLSRQFTTALGFITGDGDRSSFYLADVGIFDPVTLVLIWLGLGALLTRIRRYEESVVAAWFFLTMLFAGFLTTEQPNGPRLISVAPACYLLGGIFIARAAALLPGLARGRSRAAATAALGGLALIVLYLNWRVYFVELKTYSHSILPTAVARAVAAAPPMATVYIMGDPILYAGHGAIRFLARTENIYDLKSPDELPDPATYERGTWVLALEPGRAALQTIVDQHPGGERQAVTDEHDRFLYETYYLP